MKKYIAEIIGTFTLVFCGTGAIVIDQTTGGAIGHLGIAMTFGLVVLAMIYSIGDISGAHLNPAVTLGFTLSKRMEVREAIPYVCAQLAGAFLASFCLKLLFPLNLTLGSTLPAGGDFQSFVLEIILTFFLMFVILNVSTGAKEKGITAGIAIGATVALGALFAGPICGASMNPARSLAPAILSGTTHSLWVYLTAPFLGAILAALSINIIRPLKDNG
jgi:aquaporin NIP